MFVNYDNWPFLVPEIPDLQLVVLLVIQGHSDLGGNAFAPAYRHVSISRGRRSTVSELEDRFVGFGVPESDQAVFAG